MEFSFFYYFIGDAAATTPTWQKRALRTKFATLQGQHAKIGRSTFNKLLLFFAGVWLYEWH
jgi:hypothetical protein